MNKNFLSITLISVLHLFCLGLYQLLLLTTFGVSEFLDEFYKISMVYNFSAAIISSIITVIYVPFLIRHISDKSYINNLFYFSIICAFIFALIIWAVKSIFFIESIASIGTSPNDSALAFNIFIGVIALTFISSFLTALCTAKSIYNLPLISQVIGCVLQLSYVYLNINSLSLSNLSLSYLIIQVTSIFIMSLFLSTHFKFHKFNIKKLSKIIDHIRSIFASVIIGKSDILVDRVLLSATPSGTLTAYTTAQLIINIFLTFITKAMSLISINELSKETLNKKILFNNYLHIYSYIILLLVHIIIITFWFLAVLFSSLIENFEQISLFFYLLMGVFLGGALSVLTSNYMLSTFQAKKLAKISISFHLVFLFFKIVFFSIYGFIVIPVLMSIKSIGLFLYLANLVDRGSNVNNIKIVFRLIGCLLTPFLIQESILLAIAYFLIFEALFFYDFKKRGKQMLWT